jgi:imidazoleglycerol-phosphate dehydratase/histidinol-phosphatase
MKVAFLDRDGTLIFEPPDTKKIDSLDRLKILPGVIAGLKLLLSDGYKLVMVSNQNGIGTENFPAENFRIPQEKFLDLLSNEGVEFYKVFICPDMPEDNCLCRKPKTGLVDEFIRSENIDLEESFMLGDRATDIEFAKNIGVAGFRMLTNASFPRMAFVNRKTNETDVCMMVNLDGCGNYKIDTGVKFLDHMLEQFSRHSLVDLFVKARGDLQIDEHHTVEDVAIVLGQVLSRALGERKGLKRYSFTLPMDDTLVEVALDLGGRTYLVFNAEFRREKVGDLPTELVEHFFRSTSEGLRSNIHINVRYSRNEHHQIEAIFKAFAKAFRLAAEIDERLSDQLPSTKGIL